MSIQEKINTYSEIDKEIKRLSKQLSKLRKDAKKIHDEISNYISAKDQVGVKYNGTAFILDKKTRPVARSKKTKETCYLQIVEQYGIENPREFLDELFKAGKEEKEITRLKIQHIKQ